MEADVETQCKAERQVTGTLRTEFGQRFKVGIGRERDTQATRLAV